MPKELNKNSKILKDRSDESQTKVRRKSVKSDQQQSLDIEQSSLDSHSSNKFHSTLRWEVFPMFKCSPISPISAGASTHDRLSLFSLSAGVLDFHMHLCIVWSSVLYCFVVFSISLVFPGSEPSSECEDAQIDFENRLALLTRWGGGGCKSQSRKFNTQRGTNLGTFLYLSYPFIVFCLFKILGVLEVALKPPDCHLPFKRLLL